MIDCYRYLEHNVVYPYEPSSPVFITEIGLCKLVFDHSLFTQVSHSLAEE